MAEILLIWPTNWSGHGVSQGASEAIQVDGIDCYRYPYTGEKADLLALFKVIQNSLMKGIVALERESEAQVG